MEDQSENPIVQFFRCSDWFADAPLTVRLDAHMAAAFAAARSEDPFWQEPGEKWLTTAGLSEWVDMLRLEHYDQASTDTTVGAIVAREAYYMFRPMLGVAVRRHLQRVALQGWDQRPFPRWPVDRSVDELLELFLAAAAERKRVTRVPFIWFWPRGFSSCAMLTHDVETETGLRFCDTLMDIDDGAAIKSSFQLVPEHRYKVTATDAERFRARGFEVNVHDLNHDGHLFSERKEFRRRAKKINEYVRQFGASGFRAGALYRNQDWFDDFDFQYDMSVPNVAHLDPQHGGCCTLFPYFVGKLLELPVTATQDYSLFHVLETYDIDLWRKQMDAIVSHHGMINVITHPDYVIEARARHAYEELLAYMNDLRTKSRIWFAQPRDVNAWWRQRAQMKLEWERDHWAIRGEGSERATVAYFEADQGKATYRLESKPAEDRASV